MLKTFKPLALKRKSNSQILLDIKNNVVCSKCGAPVTQMAGRGSANLCHRHQLDLYKTKDDGTMSISFAEFITVLPQYKYATSEEDIARLEEQLRVDDFNIGNLTERWVACVAGLVQAPKNAEEIDFTNGLQLKAGRVPPTSNSASLSCPDKRNKGIFGIILNTTNMRVYFFILPLFLIENRQSDTFVVSFQKGTNKPTSNTNVTTINTWDYSVSYEKFINEAKTYKE